MSIVLGAAKDKGSFISIRDYRIEVLNDLSINIIKGLFAVPDMTAGGMSKSIDNASSIIERAIQAILICPEILGSKSLEESDFNLRAQMVLNDLLSIRGSIIESKRAKYLEYGTDFDNS